MCGAVCWLGAESLLLVLGRNDCFIGLVNLEGFFYMFALSFF